MKLTSLIGRIYAYLIKDFYEFAIISSSIDLGDGILFTSLDVLAHDLILGFIFVKSIFPVEYTSFRISSTILSIGVTQSIHFSGSWLLSGIVITHLCCAGTGSNIDVGRLLVSILLSR